MPVHGFMIADSSSADAMRRRMRPIKANRACREREEQREQAERQQNGEQSFFHVASSVSLPFDSLKSYFISSIANSLYITSVAIALISSD